MTRAKVLLATFESRQRGVVNPNGVGDRRQAQAKFSSTRSNAAAQFGEGRSTAFGPARGVSNGHPLTP